MLSYARGQASCAQSSCNAEPYMLGSCAAERRQLASLLAEQGGAVEPPLRYSDNSSTLTLVGRDGQDQAVPVIELEYWYLTGKPPEKTEDDPFAEERSSQTCVIAVHRSTGYLFASVVTGKGRLWLSKVVILDDFDDLFMKYVIRVKIKPLRLRHDPG